jgi:hypothetical protein
MDIGKSRTDGRTAIWGRWVGGRGAGLLYIVQVGSVMPIPTWSPTTLKRESQWLLLVGTGEDGRHDEEDTSKSGTSARLYGTTQHTHTSAERRKNSIYETLTDVNGLHRPCTRSTRDMARALLSPFECCCIVGLYLFSFSLSRLSFGNDNQPLCPPFSKVKQIERKINMSLRA